MAMTRAVEEWLDRTEHYPKEDEHLQKIKVILGSGDELTITAIKHNIDVFFDRLLPASQGEAQKKSRSA